jgi:hypothetical protein
MYILFFAFLLSLPILLVYAGSRIGKGATDWTKAVRAIEMRTDLPESMDFFYSKWSILWEVLLCTSATIALLSLNFLWLWSRMNHANFIKGEILVGIIFLPFTIFFGLKAMNAAALLVNIEEPVVRICRTGFQYDNKIYPWTSIERINTIGLRTPFLVIHHKMRSDERREKFTVNLSILCQRHLPEYARKYWSIYGLSAKIDDNNIQ